MVRRRRSDFLWLGNHRALDFLNTQPVVRGTPADFLPDLPALVRWLDEAGLLGGADARAVLARWDGTRAGAAVVQEAHALRAALRAMLERLLARKAPGPDALERINALLRCRAGYTEVARGRAGFGRRFHLRLDDPGQLLVPIAEATADFLCDADLALVRRCENPACVLYFYDASKNHARRWCSMEMCGNRMKSAAHYRRQRGARAR